MELFATELFGAVIQLAVFALIPFVWWLFTARKKAGFFCWIGLKRIVHDKKLLHTMLFTVLAVAVYGALTSLCVHCVSGDITTAGSQFAGKGLAAVPAALAYGYIRTGLAEEIVFRGFLLKRIGDKFGFQAGNIVQAMLFGLLHGIPFGFAAQNVLVTVLMTLLPGAFGWFQGWLNEKRCGGSIVPSWLLHGTMNFVVTCLSL